MFFFENQNVATFAASGGQQQATVVGKRGGQVWWSMQSQSLLMASSDPCHQGKDIAAAIKEMFLRNKDIFMKFSQV